MDFFEVEGGHRLGGEIIIPGAKNATLPMLCGSLLTQEPCTFTNVPNISDVDTLLGVLQQLGATVEQDKKNKTVTVTAKNIDPDKLADIHEVKHLRATILLLGPLLARFGSVTLPQPGGCVLGARSNNIHFDGLETLGAKVTETKETITVTYNRKELLNHKILFAEASVTGTENLALFLAGKAEYCRMYFCAAEPHVCATLRMVQTMGATVEGIGTHRVTIEGSENLKGGTFEIPPDNLLVGTYAIAAVLTGGQLRLQNVDHRELYSFYGALKRTGADLELENDVLLIKSDGPLQAVPKVQTAIFPGFPTDLQSPFGVLLTQCKGTSMIFETLFENRLTYLSELEKMGAKVEMLNAHQAKVTGPTPLQGCEVQSWDLRAGAAMVLAGLVAHGTTRVTNIQYIDRGYEAFEETLRSVGARISRKSA